MFSSINRTTIGILIAIGAALLWGITPTAIRATYADGGNFVFALFMTAIIRALFFTTFCATTKRSLFTATSHTKIAISNGFFQMVSTAGVAMALIYLPAAVSTILLFTYPLMLYLLLVFKKQESFNIFTIISIFSTILGLGLVLNIYTDLALLKSIGVLFALGSAIATTSRIYAFGTILQTRDAPTTGAEAYLFTLIFSGLFLIYDSPLLPSTSAGWLWATIAGFASTIASFGMLFSIKLIGSFRFSFISKLEPIFAAIIAAVLINEVLTIEQYIGIAIVIASLVFYQTQQAHKKKA